MQYFTADLHLGHRNIVDHCHRPFSSVEEMDAVLIGNINRCVSKSDILYIVGDFSLGGIETVRSNRKKIVCPQIHLIDGNHDRLSAAQYKECGFVFHGPLADIKVECQNITLCHYAMRRWNKSHLGAWHLYGHSHGHLFDDPTLLAFDVGVDCHDFYPLSFLVVSSMMADRKYAKAHPNHPELD